MFKELGQLTGLLRHLPKIKEEMEHFQASLQQFTAEGDAGGGMVKVRVNGKIEMLACTRPTKRCNSAIGRCSKT